MNRAEMAAGTCLNNGGNESSIIVILINVILIFRTTFDRYHLGRLR